MNQGRLCIDEVKKCGTYLLIMFMTSEVTMFHLPFVIFKVIQVFQNASIVSFISNENFAFRAAFAFG